MGIDQYLSLISSEPGDIEDLEEALPRRRKEQVKGASFELRPRSKH
jgi:hypothetical protein